MVLFADYFSKVKDGSKFKHLLITFNTQYSSLNCRMAIDALRINSIDNRDYIQIGQNNVTGPQVVLCTFFGKLYYDGFYRVYEK